MSSTYSSYKIELIGTGEQAGTWGTTTNTNLGTALEQAIGGYVSVAFTGLTKTLTLTNTNAAQDARALYLNLTGTPGGTATLELPAIQKAYIIKNSTTGGFSVIAKVTGMTGVVIPNGSTMTVYNNGTDVVVANNNFNDGLTLGTTVLSANSASDALRITQLGSGNALVVEDEANPDSSRFQIDSTGRVSIGTTTPGVSNLRISRTLTGGTSGASVYLDYTVASDVTGSASSYRSDVTTQATAFTLPFLVHYSATTLTLGAGSTVTDQRAFNVNSTAAGATSNYGFYSILPAAANNWNLYLPGTANNYMAGALGIGITALTGNNLVIARSLTGATTSVSLRSGFTILSDVAEAYVYQSQVSTQAAAFTVNNLYNYSITGATIGAGSTVTNQLGFIVGSTFTTGTNNYAIYSSVPSSPNNNWNFYAQGTANNYMVGALGIGSTTLTGYNLRINRQITGATTAYGISQSPEIQSDVTTAVYLNLISPATQAAAFTLPNLYLYSARGANIGAGSSITNQYGYLVESNLNTATNNFGVYSSVPSAANNWNLYANGTAPNYMAGALGIGATTLTNNKLRIGGTASSTGTSFNSLIVNVTYDSSVTVDGASFVSTPSTQATAFTLGNLYHFLASSPNIGAGSSVNNQYGFAATSGMTGATSNFGFYGATPSGANNWNFYALGAAPNYMAGALGIGTTVVGGYNFRISRNLTGGVNGSSFSNDFTALSDVTTNVHGIYSLINTQDAVYTLANLTHFTAAGGTKGASNTLTFQYGFNAQSTLSQATNNYGFYGNVTASGSSNWNFYANGTAPNYMAGALGIGQTSLTGFNLRISRNLTGATNATSISNGFVIQSDVTLAAYGYRSFISTQATAFTLPDLFHYAVEGGTAGAGSTITNQSGFAVISAMTSATNNFGFVSSLAAAANRWNLYINGTANNYIAGSLGIGSTSLTGYGLRVGKNLTGAVVSYQVSANYTVQSDVSGARTFQSAPSTQATAFTLGSLYHFVAEVPGVGAGSTITNQYAFLAASGLEVATNNYGFGSSIASGANNWNIYSSGTAKNYLAGALGIGTTSSTASLAVNRNLTGAASNSQVVCSYTVLSDVTSNAYTFESLVQTQASATLGNLIHYHVSGLIPGGGSTITNQYGIQIDDISGATNNYGVYSNLTSGSSRWNFYGQGTANNAFRGNSRFGGLTAPVATVDVTGNVAATTSILSTGATSGVGYAAGAGGAVTQLTSRTTGVTLNNVSGAITLVSAAGSTAYQTFTVTNSAVAATDVVIVNQKSGTDKYITMVTAVAAGSFQITFATTGGTTTEQPVFNFAVIKAVAA
ncbi:MAG: beta strand repeat-containing protein [Cyanobacteriota bacterium]|jgi:hypothetical protein